MDIYDGIVQEEADPTAHADSHEVGGDDLLALDSIVGNLTAAQHGAVLPLDHVANRERVVHIPVDLRVLWVIVAANTGFDAGTSTLYGFANNLAANTARLSFQVPSDFVAITSIRIKTFKTDMAGLGTISLIQAGAVDGGINAVNITPMGINNWEEQTLTPIVAYNPLDWFALEIVINAPGVGSEFRIAEIEVRYTSAY